MSKGFSEWKDLGESLTMSGVGNFLKIVFDAGVIYLFWNIGLVSYFQEIKINGFLVSSQKCQGCFFELGMRICEYVLVNLVLLRLAHMLSFDCRLVILRLTCHGDTYLLNTDDQCIMPFV